MDCWIANLSDGATKVEEWVEGTLSPWQRLMDYCKLNKAYVTNLRLTVGTQTVACNPNAEGYWQAHGMPSVQGLDCDEELHKWRGIGYVEDGLVHITWGARDPATGAVGFWNDVRKAKNQAQIIWARPQLTLPPPAEIQRGDAKVRGIREYQDGILRAR